MSIEKESKMQIPLQISFRNMDPSPAVEALHPTVSAHHT